MPLNAGHIGWDKANTAYTHSIVSPLITLEMSDKAAFVVQV